MKTVSETEATTRLDAILDEAQREPIAIRRDDRDIAVVVSLKEYERLRELNVQAFLDLRRQVASEAAANRLTEQRITDLLSDESESRSFRRTSLHGIADSDSQRVRPPGIAQHQ
jgi:PHD/YefM family antitoxin component YafN of YafNO toxin-antitoxin module